MTAPGPRLVGARVPRVEDDRLLSGHGRFVDDLAPAGLLHAAFVRSHTAHGVLRAVDVRAARGHPGVALVLTADDLDGIGPLRPFGPPDLATPSYPVLASGRVRLVGEPIAIVVADTRAVAEDACELVHPEIEPLPAVVTADDGLDPEQTPLFDEVGSNVMCRRTVSYGDVDGAFARADLVVRESFLQQRMANVPLEGRALVAAFDRETGVLEVDAAHQNPHALRLALAHLLGMDAEQVWVRCGDIGGSFGQKAYTTREEVSTCEAARRLGRPVKWVEDRTENLLAAGHARDDRLEVELAVTHDARLLGARVRMVVNQGAYQVTSVPPSIYLDLVRVLFPNAYRLEHFAFEGAVVATNTAPYIAFRGPWESESWVRERMLDLLARELGLEPFEVRRRNLVTPGDQPARMVTGPEVEHMTAAVTLERAVEHARIPEFRREQEAARADGRLLGFGLATFAEAAPGPPDYSAALGAGASSRTAQQARARLEPDGTVCVFTSQQPHGQGHETTLAQLAADRLGLALDRVRIVHGDTRVTPFNAVGTGGSRAATLASGAVVAAGDLLRRRIADEFATRHELASDDVEVTAGRVLARGVPASGWTLAELAAALDEPLEVTGDYAIPRGGWTQATHCSWVEVDPDTGQVRVLRHLVVEDCGAMINPAIVEGQIAGGVAQGVATVLLEEVVYDEQGQLRTATLLDYLLPTAAELPELEIVHVASPAQGPIDHRGVGESGAIGAPAALSNAIEDALAPYGVRITRKHLPPDVVLGLIRGARAPRTT